ncbi:hypothetical protein KP001_18745 [Geomonas subterranea]|uniref:Motility protein n=1 Tax=Geomonas subterranea TaxID=2847989 RepID=A0ABX8LHM7_9BACT|nr:hypothetical protein [Geomonas subterranea]QXE90421.1 hypothetical protein KP001_18745 [Geomonas subterranea]QXM11504.1 hypothetical protein KP002_10545 [Geomonas subterranea]
MDVTTIATMQIAGAAALARESAAMELMKNAANAQMQMANILAQQATAVNPPEGFSVYA